MYNLHNYLVSGFHLVDPSHLLGSEAIDLMLVIVSFGQPDQVFEVL